MSHFFEKYTRTFFWIALLLILVPIIVRLYLLSPVPGSQELDYVALPYFFYRWKMPLLVAGIILFIYPFLLLWKRGKWLSRTGLSLLLIFGGCVLMASRFMDPDQMFKQPTLVTSNGKKGTSVPMNSLVIGIADHDHAAAFPLEYIVYHHQVQYKLSDKDVLITYCGMCRSARVFNPVIDSIHLHFNLAGMLHHNAVLVDEETGSWWRQESGECICGPLKGKQLEEILSQQTTLNDWLIMRPDSWIMEPDPGSIPMYESMKQGFNYSLVPKPISTSGDWSDHEIILGVTCGDKQKAYRWSELEKNKLVNDVIGDRPVLIFLDSDSMTCHVWDRRMGDKVLQFEADSVPGYFIDEQTHTRWDRFGYAKNGRWLKNEFQMNGSLIGNLLFPVQAYQEYWGSWKTFNPNTLKWPL